MMEKILKITGISAIASYLLLVVKYPLRKLGFHELNAKLMKLHEAASSAVFGLGLIHAVGAVIKKRDHIAAVFTGSVFYSIYTAIIVACHLTKDPERKMKDHRALSLGSCIALVLHVCSKNRE